MSAHTKTTMKLKLLVFYYALCIINCALLYSCRAQKPVTTTHHERIETQLRPIPIGSDTIELEYRLQSTDNRYYFPTDNNNSAGVNSVGSVPSVRDNNSVRDNWNKREQSQACLGYAECRQFLERSEKKENSVRIRSTRGLNVQTTHTDSSMRIRLTLRPDTVYLPYTTHIRSDTIIAPDPTTQAKLTTARWQIAMLLLIIIVATIIFILKDRMTR